MRTGMSGNGNKRTLGLPLIEMGIRGKGESSGPTQSSQMQNKQSGPSSQEAGKHIDD